MAFPTMEKWRNWVDVYAFSPFLFLFPALILVIGDLYAVFAGILVGLGFLLFPFSLSKWRVLDNEEKWFLLVLYTFPVLLLGIYFLKGGLWSGVDYFARWLLVAPLFFVFFGKRLNHYFYIYGLLLGCFLSGAFSAWDYFINGAGRAGDSVANVGIYGQVAAGLVLSLIVLFFNKIGNRLFYLGVVGVVFGFAAMIFSGTRGVFIGFTGAVIAWYFIKNRFSLRTLLRGVVMAGVLFGLTLPFVVGQRLTYLTQEYNAYQKGDVNSSFGARAELSKAAFLLVKEHPLLGVGAGNFQSEMKRLIDKGEIDSGVGVFSHAHNQYTHIMAEFGLVGLFAFLFSIVGSAYLFLRRAGSRSGFAQSMAVAGALLVIMNAIFGISQTPYSHNMTIVYYIITIFLCWHFSGMQYNDR